MPNSQKLIQNSILLGVTLVFILFSLEAALRIIDPEKPKLIEKPKSDWALVPERIWTEYHPELGWSLQKNKTAELKIDAGKFPMKFNSLGIRGSKEYALERQSDVKRMVLIGDSFPFGWGVLDAETFASKLEARNLNLEVINLSVPGYGMDQIALSYSLVGKNFSPDIVLIGIYPEDFWRSTRAFADTGHAKPYFKLTREKKLRLMNTPVPQPFTLNTNQFPVIVEKTAVENFIFKSYTCRFLTKRLLKLGKSLGLTDPNTTDEWKLGKAILKHIIASVKASGAKPVFFTAPPERWATDTSDDSLLKSLKRFFSNEAGALFLDFTPEFRKLVAESKPSEYYIPEDRHWNAKAHDYVSKRIAEYLTQNGYPLN